MTQRKPVNERDRLGRALLATADWAFCTRTMLRLRDDEEARDLSALLLEFERRVLGYWRVTTEQE